MTKEAFLGLDLGGTGVKAGVVDCHGTLLAYSRKGFEPSITAAGHVELPISTLYEAARVATREAVEKSGARILALAISSQGETFVTLDEKDQPLHDAIIWYDSRATSQAQALKEKVRTATGHTPKLDGIYTVAKIQWLRENRPEVIARARRFCLLPDYIAYRLTGQAVYDLNTASSTGLTENESMSYSCAILDAANIQTDQVSKIVMPGTPIANIKSEIANEWRLFPKTLLVAGTNDQYAGALGAGNCRAGILSETSGTCLALVTLMERFERPVPPGLFVGRFPITRFLFALAYAKTAGVVLDWFRRELCDNTEFEVLNQEAQKASIGCGGLTVIPHFDGKVSPRPDAAMRGAVHGLNLQHSRADIYRAILESLCFALRENMEFLWAQNLNFDILRSIGGGARNDFWLQMKADVTAMAVEQPVITEAALLGAAMLAAYGQKTFQSLEESSAELYRAHQKFEPDEKKYQHYNAAYQCYLQLQKNE